MKNLPRQIWTGHVAIAGVDSLYRVVEEESGDVDGESRLVVEMLGSDAMGHEQWTTVKDLVHRQVVERALIHVRDDLASEIENRS